MDGYNVNKIRCIEDEKGKLYVAEYGKELPFIVRRVYYICNVKNKNIVRGYHAHKQLHQVMICLGGHCDIILDNGHDRIRITLDDPSKALYLEPGLWREMTNFSENSTLMVLASDEYTEEDYIRDYDQYKRYKGSIE